MIQLIQTHAEKARRDRNESLLSVSLSHPLRHAAACSNDGAAAGLGGPQPLGVEPQLYLPAMSWGG